MTVAGGHGWVESCEHVRPCGRETPVVESSGVSIRFPCSIYYVGVRPRFQVRGCVTSKCVARRWRGAELGRRRGRGRGRWARRGKRGPSRRTSGFPQIEGSPSRKPHAWFAFASALNGAGGQNTARLGESTPGTIRYAVPPGTASADERRRNSGRRQKYPRNYVTPKQPVPIYVLEWDKTHTYVNAEGACGRITCRQTGPHGPAPGFSDGAALDYSRSVDS